MFKFLPVVSFVFAFAILADAAVKPPQARLRFLQNCAKSGAPQEFSTGCFMIEVYMPESMNTEAYKPDSGQRCRNNAGALIPCQDRDFIKLFDGESISDVPVSLSPNDMDLAENRRSRLFALFLSSNVEVSTIKQVAFDPFYSKSGVLRFAPVTIERDVTVTFEYDHTGRVARQRVKRKPFPITCDDEYLSELSALKAEKESAAKPGDAKLSEVAAAARSVASYAKACNLDASNLQTKYIALTEMRMATIEAYLKQQKTSDIDVRYEDLSKCVEIKGKGCINSDDWAEANKTSKLPSITGNWKTVAPILHAFFRDLGYPVPPLSVPPSRTEYVTLISLLEAYKSDEQKKLTKSQALTIKELKTNPVKTIKTWSDAGASDGPKSLVLTEFMLRDEFPSKFSFQLGYEKNKPPVELAGPLRVISQELEQISTNAEEDTGNVGKRERPNRLDVAVQFGTSVDQKEETVNNVVVKTLERTKRGTLDVRLSPFRLRDPKAWFSIDPLFIDAKVSTGRITSDTLSVNRVVVGSRLEFTKYVKSPNGKNPTYFNFVIKPVQASDRDFKQLEYKVIGEFEPRISFLHRIPEDNIDTYERAIPSVADPVGRLYFPSSWGYKIAPLFGTEIGKTWLRRRPAEAIQPTDYIKRVYAGISMTFYAPNQISLSIKNNFFRNFGKDNSGVAVDPKENYFIATLDVGLRHGAEFGDRIFFSFVKGNEPPFGARDVNAFKIGYRFSNKRGLKLW